MVKHNISLPLKEYFVSGHTACRGCAPAVVMRWITKAAGDNTIIVHATGCMEVVSTLYPYSSWKLPWIHGAFENAAAIASGVDAALKAQNKKVNLLVIGGDGSTFDIGLQALSGAIERRHDFCYVCYDTEIYSNTGYQRSSATPKYAATTTSPYGKKIHGKQQYKKPLALIIAEHNCDYVATASPAYPLDLFKKVKTGLEMKGPAFVHVISPCVPGWKIPSNKSIELSRLAVETGIFPLYEIKNDRLFVTKKFRKLKPVREYLRLQGRFKHLTQTEIEEIQQHAKAWYNYILKLEGKGKIFP